MGLFDFLTDTIGIDPGSQNLRLIKDGKVIYNEPAIISVNKNEGTVSGIGTSILHQADHVLIKPVTVAITDFVGFEEMLKRAITKATNANGKVWRPSLIMYTCIPTDVSEVEKRAYRDSAEHSGAKEVHMINSCFVAAIGMNVLFEKKDFILLEFGASKTEISVFKDSFPVITKHIRLGLSKVISLIKNHLARGYKVAVTDTEIDMLLQSLNGNSAEEIEVKNISVKREELQGLLKPFFMIVNDELREALEEAGGDKSKKALENGIWFTGGASSVDILREGIDIGYDVKRQVGKTPAMDCINGLIKVIAEPEKYKDYLIR